MAHILIAEDEPLIAYALADTIRQTGHRVTVALDGAQALEADAADPADFLLTDINMPVMSGVVLVQSLRGRRPEIPVIVISGFVFEADPLRALPDVEFVSKPYRYPEIAKRVSQRLGSPEA